MTGPGDHAGRGGRGGRVVGVLGGGQLARMLALAGLPLGIRVRCWDRSADAPAGHVSEMIVGEFDDARALAEFARGVDVVTYEFENIPAALGREIDRRVPTRPSPAALGAGQDRVAEKTLFQRLGVPVHPFEPVETGEELARALAGPVGLPAVLKTRRMGYDGKGQAVVRRQEEAARAFVSLGAGGLIVESLVAFRRELSILGVRGEGGETRFYPLVENRHAQGVLRTSVAPAPGVSPATQATAEGYAAAVMRELGYVGVLAIEFFDTGEGLLANEMAPRVHNSGHWTIEGAVTSQFENHLRAVCGLPLGDCRARGHSVMVNLVGETPRVEEVLALPGAHMHLYGKESRPGRKVGHVTVTGEDAGEVHRVAERVRLLPGAGG